MLYRTNRRGVKFIRIDGYCSECGKSGGCLHKLSIENEPTDQASFVVMDVIQEGNHSHEKKSQMRDQAKKCIEIKDIFKKIRYVCLTPTLRCLTEIDALQNLIRNRPRDKMNVLIDRSFRVEEESLILNSTALEANIHQNKI